MFGTYRILTLNLPRRIDWHTAACRHICGTVMNWSGSTATLNINSNTHHAINRDFCESINRIDDDRPAHTRTLTMIEERMRRSLS